MFQFHPLSAATRDRLIAGGLDPDAVAEIVRRAITEDLLGGSDVTSEATVPAGQHSVATFGARRAGVVAGLPVAAATIDAVCGEAASEFEYLVDDGARVDAGVAVARVTAPTRLLLMAERTALNLLCHLSGVATLTRRWADALEGTGTVVRDTRKTTPGLRALEKAAVVAGGGVNHRFGLFDAILIKENHIAVAGGVSRAIAACRGRSPGLAIEVETETLAEVEEALAARPDRIMLDNMTPETLVRAVAMRDRDGPGIELEASGGMSLADVAAVAATGVDFISIGALTHSAPQLDLSMLITAAG